MPTSLVDVVNQRVMHAPAGVNAYAWQTELTAPEQAALSTLAADIAGQPVLDLGVGAGRTTSHLVAMGADYTGLDYSPGMVARCRARFPALRFVEGDARQMNQFADGSFAVVLFSCNGLGMVDHEGRLQILREVHRVLRPGGAFAFSFHNQNSEAHTRGLVLPEYELSANPVRLILRSARFVLRSARCYVNHRRLSKHDLRLPEYSVINDRCHDYGTMLYYITLANQRRQLAEAGFKSFDYALDLAGNVIPAGGDSRDDSLFLIARR